MNWTIDRLHKLERHYKLIPSEYPTHAALNVLDSSAGIRTMLGVSQRLSGDWGSVTPLGARLRMHEEFLSAGKAPPNEASYAFWLGGETVNA